MPVRTTLALPEPLHGLLRRRAESSGTSVRSLIVRALTEAYAEPGKKEPVTGPLVRLAGKPGPRLPRRRESARPHPTLKVCGCFSHSPRADRFYALYPVPSPFLSTPTARTKVTCR